MAELRPGGACAFPQSSLSSVPVSAVSRVSRSLERCLDTEPGLRLQRGFNSSSHGGKRFKARVPAVVAAASEAEVENGTKKLFNLPGTLKIGNKDNNIVFVAGATGNVGSRTVRELLKLGLRVRAGVRSMDKAQNVLSDAIESTSTNTTPFSKMLSLFGFKQQEQLEFVICDLEKADEIQVALGNAGVVICTIGASEKEVLDVTGPYRIDFEATKNLVVAAKSAKVKHFVLVTSLGTTKFGWPAAVLNLFWGVLVWKAKAENALIDSGLVYTIVRPGGMERPTDSYKETHNLRLGTKDSFTGGQVSRLQVAELLACIANNLELAENKILEAIAETTAPRRPIEELLEEVPSQKAQEQEDDDEKSSVQAAKKRKVAQEELKQVEGKRNAEQVKRQAEEEAKKKAIEAKEKAAEAKKSQELRQKIAKELATLKKQEELAVAEAEKLQQRRAELAERVKAAATAAEKAKAVAQALVAAAKEGKLLSEEDKRKIMLAVEAGTGKAPEITSGKVEKKPVKAVTSSINNGPKKVVKTQANRNSKVLSSETSKPVSESKVSNSVQKVSSPAQVQNEASKALPAKKELKKTATEKTSTKAPEASTTVKETKPTKEPSASVKPEEPETTPTKELSTTAKPEEPDTIPSKEAETSSEQTKAREQDALAKAKASMSTFSWPWQREEAPAAETDPKTAKDATSSPPTSRTQSPDVKPLTSPTPQPPKVSSVPEAPTSESKVAAVPATPSVSSDALKINAVPVTSSASPDPVKFDPKTVKEREQDAVTKAKASTAFVWPWARSDDVMQEKVEKAGREKQTVKPPAVAVTSATSRPLSPYWRYPDFKPPASPTPRPPKTLSSQPEQIFQVSSEADEKVAELKSTVLDVEAASKGVKEREQAALAKAKAAFTWPWKLTAESDEGKLEQTPLEAKGESSALVAGSSDAAEVSSLSPDARCPDLKPSTPEPPKAEVKAPQSEVVEPNVQAEAEKPAPLEPKTDDTSSVITPKPASLEPKTDDTSSVLTAKDVKEREQEALAKARAALAWPWTVTADTDIKAQTQAKEPLSDKKVFTESVAAPSHTRPLSPYARYPDYKPPASPTPRPPEVEKKPVVMSAKVESADSKVEEEKPVFKVEEEQTAFKAEPEYSAEATKKREQDSLTKAKAALAWRWTLEEDTADKPNEKKTGSPAASPIQSIVMATDTPSLAVSRPLSPYTRYEGFKPPCSPTPSPPKITEIAKKTLGKSIQEPSATSTVPVTDQTVAEAQARAAAALEKARASTAMKWPWN